MTLEIGYNKGKDDKIPAVSHPMFIPKPEILSII